MPDKINLEPVGIYLIQIATEDVVSSVATYRHTSRQVLCIQSGAGGRGGTDCVMDQEGVYSGIKPITQWQLAETAGVKITSRDDSRARRCTTPPHRIGPLL